MFNPLYDKKAFVKYILFHLLSNLENISAILLEAIPFLYTKKTNDPKYQQYVTRTYFNYY